MKKILTVLFSVFLILALAACGNGDNEKAGGDEGAKGGEETKKLVVGATNEPHAVILEQAKPILEEKGIDLEIKTFSKYELINPALVDGDLDANFFQHIPYLELQIEEFDYDLVNAGGISNRLVFIQKNISHLMKLKTERQSLCLAVFRTMEESFPYLKLKD